MCIFCFWSSCYLLCCSHQLKKYMTLDSSTTISARMFNGIKNLCSNFGKKNTNLSGMVSLWYDSWCWFLFAPFWNNHWITKWCAKFKLECLLLICTYTNAKFIVISKSRTLNDGDENSVKYRNRKKHCFLAAILLFIGKIIITW